MIRMIDTRIASPISIIRSDSFCNWIADLLNGNGIDSVIPVAPQYPKLQPVITDGIAKLDYYHRGNDQTKPTYRPPTTPEPIDARTEAHPEALTQLQWDEAIGKPEPDTIFYGEEYHPHPNQLHLLPKPTLPPAPRPTNKDMDSAAGVRPCYMTIALNSDDTITIRSNLDNRFPMENVKTPLRLKSGQTIKGKKLYTPRNSDTEKTYLIIDDEWYRLTPTENGFKPLFFWYYELTEKPQPPLADFFTEQDEIQTSTTREKEDEFREWQLADTFNLPEEYDISQMDEATRELSTSDKWIFADDMFETTGGKVLEKHINTGLSKDPDDRKAADIRFAKTSLPGFSLEQSTQIIEDIRLVVDDNEKLTKQYLSSIKTEKRHNCYDTRDELKRLADSIREMESSYQDDTEIATATDEMQDAITELGDLDNKEIEKLLEAGEDRGIDRDELKGIIVEAKIANDPTRSHEAHARQFNPPTPQRRDERPHDVSSTMQAAADDYNEETQLYHNTTTIKKGIKTKPLFIEEVLETIIEHIAPTFEEWSADSGVRSQADYVHYINTAKRTLKLWNESTAYQDVQTISKETVKQHAIRFIDSDRLPTSRDDNGYHPTSKNEWKDDRENKSFVISFRRLDRNQSFNVKGQIINCKKGEHILIAGDAADKIIIDQQEKAAAKADAKPTNSEDAMEILHREMAEMAEIYNPTPPPTPVKDGTAGCDFL